MKLFIGLAAAAITATGIAAAPASAHVPRPHTTCAQWRHGRCVAIQQGYTRGQVRHMQMHQMRAERRAARYNVGYRFTPSYAYTPYDQIPHNYVSQYDLNPDARYVYRDNYIYVVDPKTYAVQRVIEALTR